MPCRPKDQSHSNDRLHVVSPGRDRLRKDRRPEVAVAYAESLRAGNATEEEIKRKLGDAVNVRFVVTVALITRQQISVGGGDILRNIFTLEL